MEWYQYMHMGRKVIRPMTAGQAAELGAELVLDFDPAEQASGAVAQLLADRAERDAALVVSFAPEGDLERGYSVLEELPRRGGRQ